DWRKRRPRGRYRVTVGRARQLRRADRAVGIGEELADVSPLRPEAPDAGIGGLRRTRLQRYLDARPDSAAAAALWLRLPATLPDQLPEHTRKRHGGRGETESRGGRLRAGTVAAHRAGRQTAASTLPALHRSAAARGRRSRAHPPAGGGLRG